MPNIKSAKRRAKLSEIRNVQNKARRSALRTALKKFYVAVASGNRVEAESAYKTAVCVVDRAVSKGILHRNGAAHKKHALTLKLNKLG